MMTTIYDSLANLRGFYRKGDPDFKKERWITSAEAEVLASLIRREQIGCYFECGTANGFSTVYAAATLAHDLQDDDAPVHTWDPHSRDKVWDMRAYVHLKTMISFHNEKYNDSIKETVPLVRQGKALFFVDGEHSMQHAKNDISNTMHAASPGDIMLLHDVNQGYDWLKGRFKEFQTTHRTEFFDTERGMGAVWL